MNIKQTILFVALLLGIFCIVIAGRRELILQKQAYLSATPTSSMGHLSTCYAVDKSRFQTTSVGCALYQTASSYIGTHPLPPDPPLHNTDTEADLPVIGRNQSYDLLMLGSSHGRIFSRYHNHARVERALGASFINLSQGGDRAGVKNQQTYLRYFFTRGNRAKTVVYLLDPSVFYHAWMDNNIHQYDFEPFRLDFLRELLTNRPGEVALLKTYTDMLTITPTITDSPEYRTPIQTDATATPSSDAVTKRLNRLYADEYSDAQYNSTLNEVLKTVHIATSHNARIAIVIPATLLPTLKQEVRVYDTLTQLSQSRGFTFHNYSHVFSNTYLFVDTDHLNTEGVVTFTNRYLKPLL